MAITSLAGLWAGIYIASLATALWKDRNRRGAILSAIFALLVVMVPLLSEWVLHNRR